MFRNIHSWINCRMPGSGHCRYRIRLLFIVLLLGACTRPQLAVPPDVVHEQVHSGGKVVGFSRSGELLASGGWSGDIHVWRMPEGVQVAHWLAHGDTVNGLAFVDQDRRMVTAGYDGRLAEWAPGGALLRSVSASSPITHMVVNEVTDRVLTGHRNGTVRVWQLEDFSLVQEQQLHQGAVKAVAIDPVGQRYASSGTDGAVFTWGDKGIVQRLENPPTDAWTLTFSPDGRLLYGGGWFRLFRWRIDSGTLVTLPTRHHGIIRSIQFTEKGDELASISRQTDSSVYFLDPATGEITRRFQQHELCGAAVAVSSGDRYLATTSDDASVRIWRLGPPDAVAVTP